MNTKPHTEKYIAMKMLIALCFIILLAPGIYSQDNEEKATAFILHEVENNVLQVNASCTSNTVEELELKYEMKIEKNGITGSATNRQSGKFKLKGNEKKTMASNKFNISDGDIYKVTLKIFEEEALVSEDSLTYTLNKKDKQR